MSAHNPLRVSAFARRWSGSRAAPGRTIAAIRASSAPRTQQYRIPLGDLLYRRYLADLLDVDRHAREGHLLVAEIDGVVLGSGAFYPDVSTRGLGWPTRLGRWPSPRRAPAGSAARCRPGPARRLRTAGSRARCAGLRVPHRQPDDRGSRPVRAPRLHPSASPRPGPRGPLRGRRRTAPSTLSPTTASWPTRPTPSASARPNTQPKGSPHDQSTNQLLDQLRHRGHRPLVRRGAHRLPPARGDHRYEPPPDLQHLRRPGGAGRRAHRSPVDVHRSSSTRSTLSPAACSGSAWRRATGSASGRRTARSGPCCSTPPPTSAPSW